MKSSTREVRSLGGDEAELRASEGEGPALIEGLAARYNVLSNDMMFGREIIMPGAFTKTVKEADVRATWNHDPNFVLGRVSAGTLALTDDKVGLRHRIEPPDTQWARDLTESIRRRDVRDMSFGFRTIRQNWRTDGDEIVRELLEVELLDVAPVAYPAYPRTDVAVRSLLLHEGAKEEELGDFSELLEAALETHLTPAEFRSILAPVTRELRNRKPAPAQKDHAADDERARAIETRRMALNLLEVED